MPSNPCLQLGFACSKAAPLDVDLGFPLSDRLFPFFEIRPKPIAQRHRLIEIRIVERGQLVFDEQSDRPAHRDADEVAVPPPRRPHRIRHRHLDELRTLPMIELSEHAAIDASEDSTVKRQSGPPASDDHTVASYDAESTGIPPTAGCNCGHGASRARSAPHLGSEEIANSWAPTGILAR